jgi:uncharacterized protein (DUF1697 family)
MKMEMVCKVFEQSGMSDVSSVLASGNIVFSSTKSKSTLKKLLEKSLSEKFNYEAFLFLKDENEIKQIIGMNPFKPQPEYHIYSFAGIDGIEEILMNEFKKSQKSEFEKAQIEGGNFYWKIIKGNTLKTEFSKVLGNKKLKDSFTSRNINTFERVLKIM